MTMPEQPPSLGDKFQWPRVLLACVLLGILPFTYLTLARNLTSVRGPVWLGTNSDPSYCYLLNSLLIVNHQTPFLIEHPGTTAQLGGAIVLRARSPSATAAQITEEVLNRPEDAVESIIATFDTITAASLFGFGIIVWQLGGDLLLAMLFQSAMLFFRQTYLASITFAPELFFPPLCLALGTIVVAGMRNPHSMLWPLLAGGLAGVCVMVKLTFLPFLALGFIVFQPARLKLWYLAAMLVVLAAYACFIRSELPRVWSWISNLVTHSGRYGGGPKEVIDWKVYFPTLLRFLRDDLPYLPLLLSGPMVPLFSMWKRSVKEVLQDPVNRVLCALSLLEAGCFVMTAKHPASHYLIPVVAMAPLHLLLIGKALERAIPSYAIRFSLVAVLAGSGLLAGTAQYRLQKTLLSRAAQEQLDANREFASRLRAADPARPWTPVYYYRTSSLEYSLFFGNGYSRNYFAASLSRLYPRTWFFNIFNARFHDFTETITGDEFYRRHPHPLFFGSNSIEEMPFGLQFPLPPESTLERLWKNPQASIHQIRYR